MSSIDQVGKDWIYSSSKVSNECSSTTVATSMGSEKGNHSSSNILFKNDLVNSLYNNHTKPTETENRYEKVSAILESIEEDERPKRNRPISKHEDSFYRQIFDDQSESNISSARDSEEKAEEDFEYINNKPDSLSRNPLPKNKFPEHIFNYKSLINPSLSQFNGRNHRPIFQSLKEVTKPMNSIIHQIPSYLDRHIGVFTSARHNQVLGQRTGYAGGCHNFTQNAPASVNTFSFYSPVQNSIKTFNPNFIRESSRSSYNQGSIAMYFNPFADSLRFLEGKLQCKDKISKFEYEAIIKGKVIGLASSRESSKKMQKAINLFLEETVNAIFNEIFSQIIPNLNSNFCNFFLQKFLKVLNKPQRIQILELFKESNFYSLCCNTNSVYLVVSIIEKVNSLEEMNIVSSQLGSRYLNLMVHQTGYRVLEKVILKFEEKYFDRIIPSIINNFVNYSKDSYASEVIKILLFRISKSSKFSSVFSQLIIDNLLELSSNKVSNSVVVASLFVRLLL